MEDRGWELGKGNDQYVPVYVAMEKAVEINRQWSSRMIELSIKYNSSIDAKSFTRNMVALVMVHIQIIQVECRYALGCSMIRLKYRHGLSIYFYSQSVKVNSVCKRKHQCLKMISN